MARQENRGQDPNAANTGRTNQSDTTRNEDQGRATPQAGNRPEESSRANTPGQSARPDQGTSNLGNTQRSSTGRDARREEEEDVQGRLQGDANASTRRNPSDEQPNKPADEVRGGRAGTTGSGYTDTDR